MFNIHHPNWKYIKSTQCVQYLTIIFTINFKSKKKCNQLGKYERTPHHLSINYLWFLMVFKDVLSMGSCFCLMLVERFCIYYPCFFPPLLETLGLHDLQFVPPPTKHMVLHWKSWLDTYQWNAESVDQDNILSVTSFCYQIYINFLGIRLPFIALEAKLLLGFSRNPHYINLWSITSYWIRG